jgi:hypothetical protein
MRPIPLFCALAMAASAWAQSRVAVEATAELNPTGGGATITVHNNYSSSMVAFVFVYTLRSADAIYSASTGFYDSAIDPANKPIAPGDDAKVPYYAGSRGMVPVANIEAALFADGTTFGHKDMVQTIFERRNFTLVTLNKIINELKQAAKHGLARNDLIAQMQTSMGEERAAAGNNGNNDLATCIMTVRNQVFMDVMVSRQQPMDQFLPAEIEKLTARREALLPPKR